MSKIVNFSLATAAALATLATAAPTMAQQANGITNCDAPGGRQATGAVIGGVLGALVGSQISSNERGLGAVAGGAAGAAAGSYVGCNQQRTRALGNEASSGAQYQSTANLRIRSGPGTSYSQRGMLQAGQPFTAIGSEGEWVQIAGGGWVSARYVAPY